MRRYSRRMIATAMYTSTSASSGPRSRGFFDPSGHTAAPGHSCGAVEPVGQKYPDGHLILVVALGQYEPPGHSIGSKGDCDSSQISPKKRKVEQSMVGVHATG